MKKLFVLLMLLCGCQTNEPPPPLHPKESVVSQNEPIEFTGRSKEFFQWWFAQTNEWPTQADVDAWEKAMGYKKFGHR